METEALLSDEESIVGPTLPVPQPVATDTTEFSTTTPALVENTAAVQSERTQRFFNAMPAGVRPCENLEAVDLTDEDKRSFNSYIYLSIVHVIFCLFPLGLFALWYSAMSKEQLKRGNISRALAFADRARKLNIFGIVAAVATYGIAAAIVTGFVAF
eukprot:m.5496 g.5496  ORF g.5496 m.5496 type:complete len:157 (+) comp13300_c0_seq2:185-655(+)